MKNEILKKIQNYIMFKEISHLNIQIPNSLFYYAEGLENGCENYLEGKKILIEVSGEDVRDNHIISIVIREGRDSLDDFVLKEPVSHVQNICIELSYQKARKLTLDMIVAGTPYSVNLTTR